MWSYVWFVETLTANILSWWPCWKSASSVWISAIIVSSQTANPVHRRWSASCYLSEDMFLWREGYQQFHTLWSLSLIFVLSHFSHVFSYLFPQQSAVLLSDMAKTGLVWPLLPRDETQHKLLWDLYSMSLKYKQWLWVMGRRQPAGVPFSSVGRACVPCTEALQQIWVQLLAWVPLLCVLPLSLAPCFLSYLQLFCQ